jgi:hypothetical protein
MSESEESPQIIPPSPPIYIASRHGFRLSIGRLFLVYSSSLANATMQGI